MVDLPLDRFFIEAMVRSPEGRGPTPFDVVEFKRSDEEQNEAIETLKEFLASEEEDEEESEDSMSTIVGPKRIEVEITRKTGVDRRTRCFVVTHVSHPQAHFKSYSLRGREWRNSDGKLENYVSVNMTSELYWLEKITSYHGGQSRSASRLYGKSEGLQREAWERLAEFWDKMQPAEQKVVDNWHPPAQKQTDDDEDDASLYSYSGYNPYNHVPYTYRPPVGFFRVRGDDLGPEILREQKEAEAALSEEERTIDIRAYLEIKEKAEKKAEAGDAGDEAPAGNRQVASPHSQGSGGRRHGASPACLSCGSPVCTACPGSDPRDFEPDEMTAAMAAFAYGMGSPTIH